MRKLTIVLAGLIFSACATMQPEIIPVPDTKLPVTFTTENIMKVHTGMTSDEILKMFGTPKSISQSVCGSDTGNLWSCTTWEYGKFPYEKARFNFSGDQHNKVLNDFSIER